MLFPHPSDFLFGRPSGFMLFTRCLPRLSNGLANITATLGSFYWLGFETSCLSHDKKRLALLGAQRRAQAPLPAGASDDHRVEVVVTGNHRNWTAGRGCLARLVSHLCFESGLRVPPGLIGSAVVGRIDHSGSVGVPDRPRSTESAMPPQPSRQHGCVSPIEIPIAIRRGILVDW